MLSVTALAGVRGERQLFADLNFTLAPYTLLEVRGPNGSGKTTLLRILCGLCLPALGRVTWHARDISAVREEYHSVLCYIGHLNGINDALSAQENLSFSQRTTGHALSSASVAEALRAAGLAHIAHLPCSALSHGQRRLVALARLLLNQERMLWILDEPFTALDAATIDRVSALVNGHLERGGIVALSTHHQTKIVARHVQHVELD